GAMAGLRLYTQVMLRAAHGDQREEAETGHSAPAADQKTGIKTHQDHYSHGQSDHYVRGSEGPRITTAQEATSLSPAAKQYFKSTVGLRLGNTGEKSSDVEDKAR